MPPEPRRDFTKPVWTHIKGTAGLPCSPVQVKRIAALYTEIHKRAPTTAERQRWQVRTRQEAAETIARFELALQDIRNIRDLRPRQSRRQTRMPRYRT